MPEAEAPSWHPPGVLGDHRVAARPVLCKSAPPRYPRLVTIASRRRIYWGLFVAAALCLAVALFLSVPVFARAEGVASFKALGGGAYRELSLGRLKLDSVSTSSAGILLASLYSLLCLGFILATFRKTVSSEIFFFSFWVLSFGMESLRFLIVHFAAIGAPVGWSIAATRVILGSRIVGLLSFFAAGLHAAGFRNDKLGSAIGVIVVAGWALAYVMPIDTGSYLPVLMLRPGYAMLSMIVAAIAGLVIVANLIYASFSSGERSYRIAALGAAAALAGQRLLVAEWQPLAIASGAALLVFGSWLFISRLHAYYLWQ